MVLGEFDIFKLVKKIDFNWSNYSLGMDANIWQTIEMLILNLKIWSIWFFQLLIEAIGDSNIFFVITCVWGEFNNYLNWKKKNDLKWSNLSWSMNCYLEMVMLYAKILPNCPGF